MCMYNGLWQIPITTKCPSPTQATPSKHAHEANGVIKLECTKGELTQYYGATMFNAVKSTIIRAINRNHFTSWPGMTSKLMRKHLPQRLATAQGHLDQDFKNV